MAWQPAYTVSSFKNLLQFFYTFQHLKQSKNFQDSLKYIHFLSLPRSPYRPKFYSVEISSCTSMCWVVKYAVKIHNTEVVLPTYSFGIILICHLEIQTFGQKEWILQLPPMTHLFAERSVDVNVFAYVCICTCSHFNSEFFAFIQYAPWNLWKKKNQESLCRKPSLKTSWLTVKQNR